MAMDKVARDLRASKKERYRDGTGRTVKRDRLPHLATFSDVRYDAARVMWTGRLTVPCRLAPPTLARAVHVEWGEVSFEERTIVVTAEAGAVMTLLSVLDEKYRAKLAELEREKMEGGPELAVCFPDAPPGSHVEERRTIAERMMAEVERCGEQPIALGDLAEPTLNGLTMANLQAQLARVKEAKDWPNYDKVLADIRTLQEIAAPRPVSVAARDQWHRTGVWPVDDNPGGPMLTKSEAREIYNRTGEYPPNVVDVEE